MTDKIEQQAREIANTIWKGVTYESWHAENLVKRIEHALLAARKEGEETMREKAVKEIDNWGAGVNGIMMVGLNRIQDAIRALKLSGE